MRKERKQRKGQGKEACEDHATKSGHIERKSMLRATAAKQRDEACEARECYGNLGGSQ